MPIVDPADVAACLDEQKRERLRARVGAWCDIIPHFPTSKQTDFLRLDCLEALYGGAAGGGKSDALLMAALQYVSVKGYAALLLRRTYSDLSLPGALMDRADQWLRGRARWRETEKTWEFKSGATLTFGYLEAEKDKYRYQSSEFQFVGFDELTQFSQTQYEYLFSRLRRLVNSNVPLRMRGATNPDGEGLDWVKARFVPAQYLKASVDDRFSKTWVLNNATFVPARLEDNPHIDQTEYALALDKLDASLNARLRYSDWDATPSGEVIRAEWFRQDKFFPDLPDGAKWRVRAWDLAVKDKEVLPSKRKGKPPDFHASVKATTHNSELWLGAPMLWRGEWPDAVERIMSVMMIESSVTHGTGKANHETAAVQTLIRKGFGLTQYEESTDKLSRALGWINQAKIGKVKLVGTPEQWKEFMFWWFKFGTSDAAYDDSVDAVSGVSMMLGLTFGDTPPPPKPNKFMKAQHALYDELNVR